MLVCVAGVRSLREEEATEQNDMQVPRSYLILMGLAGRVSGSGLLIVEFGRRVCE